MIWEEKNGLNLIEQQHNFWRELRRLNKELKEFRLVDVFHTVQKSLNWFEFWFCNFYICWVLVHIESKLVRFIFWFCLHFFWKKNHHLDIFSPLFRVQAEELGDENRTNVIFFWLLFCLHLLFLSLSLSLYFFVLSFRLLAVCWQWFRKVIEGID